MKIKPEHLAILNQAIKPLITVEVITRYELGNFPRADKVIDLNTRFRFDMLAKAALSSWVCKVLYLYLNDTHIATALKSILPRLTKRY